MIISGHFIVGCLRQANYKFLALLVPVENNKVFWRAAESK
jgi:hypothetical protein